MAIKPNQYGALVVAPSCGMPTRNVGVGMPARGYRAEETKQHVRRRKTVRHPSEKSTPRGFEELQRIMHGDALIGRKLNTPAKLHHEIEFSSEGSCQKTVPSAILQDVYFAKACVGKGHTVEADVNPESLDMVPAGEGVYFVAAATA